MCGAGTKINILRDNSIRCDLHTMQVKVKYTVGFVPCTKRCFRPTVYISLFWLQSDAGIFHLFQIHWKSTSRQLCFHCYLQTWTPNFLRKLFSCCSSMHLSLSCSSWCFRWSLHNDAPLALAEIWQVKWQWKMPMENANGTTSTPSNSCSSGIFALQVKDAFRDIDDS